MATRASSPARVAEIIPSRMQRRFTVDEYHRMIDAGILDEGDRVQLVGGVLVEMSPQSERHARVIQRLTRLLVRAAGEDSVVRPQLPLTLGGDSEPEPDLAVVAQQDASSREEHPKTARLVIEVAGESLRLDRDVKGPVYAAAGIAEYWIVDLDRQSIEVLRDPDPVSGRYRASSTAAGAEVVGSDALPGLSLTVMSLFD